MRIEDGTGNGYVAGVDDSKRLNVSARSNQRAYYTSRDGNAYSIIAVDAGPVAAEYTLYFKNTHDSDTFVIDKIHTWATDADVVWKLHKVTGTGAGTAIAPVNANFASGKSASATCLGGAAGVTGLTSSATVHQWRNGVANQTVEQNDADVFQVGPGQAFAIEYDAGTGGAVLINVIGYYD